jgi:hypothetical protein
MLVCYQIFQFVIFEVGNVLRLNLLGVRKGECNWRSDLGRERSGYGLKQDEELPSSPRRSGLPATMTEVISPNRGDFIPR